MQRCHTHKLQCQNIQRALQVYYNLIKKWVGERADVKFKKPGGGMIQKFKVLIGLYNYKKGEGSGGC